MNQAFQYHQKKNISKMNKFIKKRFAVFLVLVVFQKIKINREKLSNDDIKIE